MAERTPPPVRTSDSTNSTVGTAWDFWKRQPLYLRILVGFGLGIVFGLLLGERAHPLEIPSKLVLRLLGALAPPLILIAVVQALMQAEFPQGSGRRLLRLLLLNTFVAICIGLLVANVLQPGRWSNIERPGEPPAAATADPLGQFLDNVPRSLLGPFTDNGKVIGVILIALALGIALRRLQGPRRLLVIDLVGVAFDTLLVLLHWIIEVIPLAVFGIVASIVGTSGFSKFVALGGFVAAVIVALLLQTTYYLLRIRGGSWVRPADVLRGMRDALVMAFSTASSTATMPLTYDCLVHKVGVRERSASLGALVGANFNNDGTALYEAMSGLFVGQLLGLQLSFWQQVMVVLTSIAASVGAAGIPEAGLVTMTLVFNAVGLPTEFIALLLTVDWFLDRCRTTVNVMGDVNVSCLLDGRERAAPASPSQPSAATFDLESPASG
ncbi:MAG: dicarboxylate/amino acid:cation symporter [Planctomycetaceae bacterium]|nr:dicarboxylate/amino acid:cation symporter [Planctomycetaceae bacterium]